MYSQTVDIEQRKAWLKNLAAACRETAGEGQDAPQLQRERLGMQSPEGKRLYDSFTDQELLDVLRERAEALGHSPAQKEVFWAYRAYIKKRFEKWPYALKAAGLSRSAGKGGKSVEQMEREAAEREAVLGRLRALTEEKGRIAHPSDLNAGELELLRRKYRDWGEVLSAAGVECTQTVSRLENLEPEHRQLLAALREKALELGRPPLRSEVDMERFRPLVRRCGSWRNTLFQIGLEPVTHITPFSSALLDRPGGRRHKSTLYDCYYQVLNLDEKAVAQLEELRLVAKKLGRAPKRKEVDPELRQNLQAVCGSWANALHQIGLGKEQ